MQKDSSLPVGSLAFTGAKDELISISTEKQNVCDCLHCQEIRKQQTRHGIWLSERNT